MIRTACTDHVAALGPEWDALFAAGPGAQSRRAWFEATEAAALTPGARPHYVTVQDDARPAALLPMQAGPGAAMTSLTSPYTVLFQPLLAAHADPAAIARALGRHLRAWPVTLIEALDPTWPLLPAVLAGLRRAGLVPTRFDHFGNWHEDVAGLDWPTYLARRPSRLRETIRRKGKLAARDPNTRFEIVQTPEALPAALDAYEAIYARSWKTPEPHPRFNAELLPRMAAAGTLRLALLWVGDIPMAAQYWTLDNGEATVLKLAHDEAARAISPGTLLTAHVIRTLLAAGGVRRLDFGRGDDDYKQQWAATRHQRIGIMLANPLRPTGIAALARHWAGQLRRAIRPPPPHPPPG